MAQFLLINLLKRISKDELESLLSMVYMGATFFSDDSAQYKRTRYVKGEQIENIIEAVHRDIVNQDSIFIVRRTGRFSEDEMNIVTKILSSNGYFSTTPNIIHESYDYISGDDTAQIIHILTE